ncbi:hypothetical protein OHB31_18745 [Streptomyces microflavus]|uniref:hypothetical protein n=1 Tax=Streptomyces griseus group TaxID=629295 RepID=UPI002DDA945E|nr:hypothetical protein [Streptomyces microflavus]WSA62073.1 hypothetical protein OHB31_18745 [Streptomyces microflavus]
MTKTRFSHAACDHASTKAARAKCRKEMRGEAVASAASTPKPVAVTPTKMKDPRKVAAALKVESAPAVETPTADESAPAVQTETVPAAEPVEITPDTWRDHKDAAALVHINGVAEPFAAQCITGWSIKFLQFTDSEGKRQRIPASTVERVTV